MAILSLFGNKSVEVETVEESESLLSTREIEPQEEEEIEARKRHAELAGRLGVKAAYTGERLVDFLKAEGIQLFSVKKVKEHLKKQGEWRYYALRESDISGFAGTTGKWPLYRELVPWEVLLTVEKIAARFPTAQFLVAALKKEPDPFLGVQLRDADSGFYIIERWDEPGFRS